MDDNLKTVISEVYTEWGLPADQIVCDPQLSRSFTEQVNGLSAKRGQVYRIVEVNRGLLRMRKAGQLPRVGRVAVGWVESDE